MAQRRAGGYNLFQILSVVAVVTSLVGLVVAVTATQQQTNTQSGATGNGAPSGPAYVLNVIGVKNTSNFNGGRGGGNVIFVPLTGNCKINLTESTGEFSVLDGNCVDDGSANFSLPNPDPTNSGTTTYSVWVRPLGKPGGSSIFNTCANDATGTKVCSIYTSVSTRDKGKSTFTNVSSQLLYIYYYDTTLGRYVRVPLFDSSLQGYFWNYDNNGLKLLQMRFYPVSTTVSPVPTGSPTP